MSTIRLQQLTKRFGETTALDGLDLTVEEGEIFGFLGPNGAGKTTTIGILLGFVHPTSGSAEIFGLDVEDHGTSIRQRTGVLPEGYTVYERLTGRQHMQYVRRSKGIDANIDRVLDRVGLEDAGDRKAGEYSKGMCQRLLLGMALLGDPDLLILDEPSTGLDPQGVRDVREIIRQEAAEGTTVFFSSHILSQVEPICDRVGILKDGRLAAVDTIDGLREQSINSHMYVQRTGMTDGAAQAVRKLDGVTDVTAVEDRTKITLTTEADVEDIRETLESAGVDSTEYEMREASLEDIFLSYVEDEQPRSPGGMQGGETR